MLTIGFFEGSKSDWRAYQFVISNCEHLRCTYFEPLFDLLVYISSLTIGFHLMKIAIMIVAGITFFIIVRQPVSNFYKTLAIISVMLAILPLSMGAIRQFLVSPLLILAPIYFLRSQYTLALILTIFFSGFHYSALLFSGWFSISNMLFLRYLDTRELRRFVVNLALSLLAIWFLFQILAGGGGVQVLSILARIGQTGRDSNYLAETGFLKDFLIICERSLFSILCIRVFNVRQLDLTELDTVFLKLYISGSIFFFLMFMLDRNIAGRSLAMFRIADIYVVFFVPMVSFRGRLVYVGSLMAAICFLLSRVYFTIVSVGFFDA